MLKRIEVPTVVYALFDDEYPDLCDETCGGFLVDGYGSGEVEEYYCEIFSKGLAEKKSGKNHLVAYRCSGCLEAEKKCQTK